MGTDVELIGSKNNMATDDKKAAFRTWITRKWSEWDAQEGRRTTQQELADYLGLNRGSVAQYVSGRQIPEGENVLKIARKFGQEIYSVLGIVPDELGVMIMLDGLPSSVAEDLVGMVSEISAVIAGAGVDPDSEEGVRITNEMLRGWLSKYISHG